MLAAAGRAGLHSLPRAWGLRTPWRRALAGVAVALASLLLTAFVPVLVGQALGWVHLKPWSVVGGALALLPLYLVVGSVSTLGEEVVWRAHLPQLLSRVARWRVAGAVAGLWTLWHVPQFAMLVARGELTVRDAGAGLVGLVLWSLALTALAFRFGSVWPAVVGHALPFRAASLVVALPADPVVFWAYAALEGVALVALAVLAMPRDARR